jgi:aminopeptidase N
MIGQSSQQNSWKYDVRHYGFHLNVRPEQKHIDGYVEYTIQIVDSTNQIDLALSEKLTIDSSVGLSDSLIDVVRSGENVKVILNRVYAKNEFVRFSIYYHGYPVEAKRAPWDGGLVWKKDNNGNHFCGVACEGEGAKLWWPVKDDLSDEPDSMDLYFQAPETYEIIGNGKLIDVDSTQNIWHWKILSPINPYNVTFYLGQFKNWQSTYYRKEKDQVLDYYVLEDNLALSKVHFQQAEKMMEIFEKYFGPFPFEKDGYKLVEAPYLGMEHQTAIAYGNQYQDGYLSHHIPGIPFDYIIIHETAHEWWGNHVSMSHRDHLWIHESFTTYAELIYVQEVYGDSLAQVYRNAWMRQVRNKSALVGVEEGETMPTGDVYAKGALVLHGLRNLVGDSLFFAYLKQIQINFSNQTIGTQELLNFTGEYLGHNAMQYLHYYLYNAGLPKVIVNTKRKCVSKRYEILLGPELSFHLNRIDFPIEHEVLTKKQLKQKKLELKSKYLLEFE